MNCLNRDALFAYTHNLLEAREGEQVRAHVAECALCRTVVEEYDKLKAVLDEWKPAEPSPWFDARLRAALATEHAKTRTFASPWVRRLIPAALAAICLAAVVLLWNPSRANRSVRSAARKSATPVSSASQPVEPANPVVAQNADAAQELEMYQNLPILEDYDMLANFDVLSEMPKAGNKADD